MDIKNLKQYATAREQLLKRIVVALRADERVAAAWLSGSIGRGEGDEWADYDLVVAIEDASLRSFLADRPALYAQMGVISHLQKDIPGQGNVDEAFNLVNFDGAIEVDWSFQPASKAQKPAGHVLLFERRPFPSMQTLPLTEAERRLLARRWASFFWAMAPIAVKYAGRGDSRRAAGQVNLLSRALISLWRLLEEPDGPDPWQPDTNRPLEGHLNERLPQLGTVISPRKALHVITALCEEAERLQSPLAKLDAAVKPKIIEDTANLAAIAERVIANGRFLRQKYR